MRLTLRPLVLAPIRFGLGLAGLLAAIVVGERPGVALVGFAAGAGGGAFLLATDPRGRRRPEPLPLPAQASFDSWRDVARSGIFPSTVGVAALAAAALVFEPTLAAVLAGILARMAVATVLSWVELASWERQLGGTLFAERGGGLFLDRRATGDAGAGDG